MIKAIYFSPTKTTAKIIKQITNQMQAVLQCQSQIIDISLPSQRMQKISFAKQDVLLIGVPVYAGRIPGFLEDFIKSLKGNNNLAIAINVYGNRDYDDALLELVNLLNANKFNVISAGAFIGEHSYSYKLAAGRPDKEDLQLAVDFANKVVKKIYAIRDNGKTEKIAVKGNIPYKERVASSKITPVTKTICVKCMLCSKNCPVSAIDQENPFAIDEEKCTRCFACVKNCPCKAKYFDNENLLATINRLETSFANRKEPEFFI